MKLLKWINSRQEDSFVNVLPIFVFKRFDCYIIHYPSGGYIGPHKDECSAGKHYRMNIVLWGSKSGGKFICEKYIINWKRFKLFRPDIYEHSVAKVEQGNRWIFSIGFAI